MAGVESTGELFNFDDVFEVDDYLYFYGPHLTAERSEAEVEALVQALQLDHPLDILDLACGFGRHANRLAARGQRVTGVDRSPGFLHLARQDAAAQGLAVRYLQLDAREINFQAEFDRVLMVFTSFGYFEDAGNLLVLQNIARALRPGGLFGFDIHNRDMVMKNMQPFWVDEKEGNLQIDRSTFDSTTGLWTNQRIVIRDGVRRDKPFHIRMYNLGEIRDLLGQAGLQIEQVFAGWSGQPFKSDSARMAVVAKKA